MLYAVHMHPNAYASAFVNMRISIHTMHRVMNRYFVFFTLFFQVMNRPHHMYMHIICQISPCIDIFFIMSETWGKQCIWLERETIYIQTVFLYIHNGVKSGIHNWAYGRIECVETRLPYRNTKECTAIVVFFIREAAMEERYETNQVTISGWVEEDPVYSHALYGEAFYTFPMVVPRLSGAQDILPVTAGERVFSRLPEKGEEWLLLGQLRSYNKQTQQGNRLVVTVFVRQLLEKPGQEAYRNEITLMGYVCKPPVYRTTPFQREIADLLLAVNRSYHKSDYLPVIAWGRNARFASNLKVGDCVLVSGRVQSREYQKNMPDGTVVSRVTYEVSAASLEKLGEE